MGRGVGWASGAGRGQAGAGYGPDRGIHRATSRDEEIEMLRQTADMLSRELREVQTRLDELEKSSRA
jgi:hypothetical protein